MKDSNNFKLEDKENKALKYFIIFDLVLAVLYFVFVMVPMLQPKKADVFELIKNKTQQTKKTADELILQKTKPAEELENKISKEQSRQAISSYMKELETKIKSNWNPPKLAKSHRVVTVFAFDKDGAVTKAKIKESSGDEKTDKSALEAIYASAPFESPQKIGRDTVEIEFTFDYNVRYEKI